MESKNAQEILEKLKTCVEIDPYTYDGSYELLQKTIGAYSHLSDVSSLDYHDLNLVYHMVIGSWKQSFELKKQSIESSHLLQEDKEALKQFLNAVWKKAEQGFYQNGKDENGNVSVGMFGTGFFSFKEKTTSHNVQQFIKMCVGIRNMTDDDQIYDVAEKVLTSDFQGMKAASASVILHCLKPMTFPIFNANMGNENIFVSVGLKLDHIQNIETYIPNCRIIEKWKNENFAFRNYRVFDLEARKLSEFSDHSSDYWPSLSEYDPGITKEQYKEALKDEAVVKPAWLEALLQMYKLGGEASCKQLGEKYGHNPSHYVSYLATAAGNVGKKLHVPDAVDTKDNKEYAFPILFQGRNVKNIGYFWRMRKRLYEAITDLINEGYFNTPEWREKASMLEQKFPLNQILYGPPGTGKTYNTVNYAVAICDGRTIEDVEADPYNNNLKRFDELKEDGRIAFTTFHQSYGYEEFIEGIKPKLDSEDSSLSYVIEDGIFKRFCKRAGKVNLGDGHQYGISDNPNIWGMLLNGTGMTALKKQCFADGSIRTGWSDIKDDEIDEKTTAKSATMLYQFMNEMQQGDIVLIQRSEHSIDAVGIITGDYEYDPDGSSEFPRKRPVRWIMKDHEVNIMKYLPEGRSQLSRYSIFNFTYLGVETVSRILQEAGIKGLNVEEQSIPYVFIIDEINRGNISKIFGELITLIEETKRKGGTEAAEVILPYSGEKFSVPGNVYIIGTMNTADRSIALMDTALRRRFSFVEMLPDSGALNKLGVGVIEADGISLNVAKMLDTINERISFLYDREHTIGHAYFTRLASDPSIETLADIFKMNVIPLLQEYFYEDYEKIQLVLGDDAKANDEYKFIVDRDADLKKIFKRIPDLDLPPKTYEINEAALYHIESYKEIGDNL